MGKKVYLFLHLFVDEESIPSASVDVFEDLDAAVKELEGNIEGQQAIEKENMLGCQHYNMELCRYLVPYFKVMGNPKYLAVAKSKSIYNKDIEVTTYRAIFEKEMK